VETLHQAGAFQIQKPLFVGNTVAEHISNNSESLGVATYIFELYHPNIEEASSSNLCKATSSLFGLLPFLFFNVSLPQVGFWHNMEQQFHYIVIKLRPM
jgi:hypothetical protein